jgi:hypothetical protein
MSQNAPPGLRIEENVLVLFNSVRLARVRLPEAGMTTKKRTSLFFVVM